jgi:hypothetical protein
MDEADGLGTIKLGTSFKTSFGCLIVGRSLPPLSNSINVRCISSLFERFISFRDQIYEGNYNLRMFPVLIVYLMNWLRFSRLEGIAVPPSQVTQGFNGLKKWA